MIIVFGSLNMDLVAAVPHLPVPGETVLCDRYDTMPGGKGNNQAVAAARAGGRVAMAGALGRDGFGIALRDALAVEGVDHQWVVDTDRPTGIAMIAVDSHGENAITVAAGANGQADDRVISDAALGADTILLMQMETPLGPVRSLLRRGRAVGAKTVLNTAPALALTPDDLAGLDCLVANEGEIAVMARALDAGPGEDPGAAAAAVRTAGVRACVVTLGAQGVLVVDRAGATRIAGFPANVVDTTGAGDTFCGVLAQSLAAGYSLRDAARRGAAAGALACEALGAQMSMPRSEQIADLSRLPAKP